MDKKLFMAFNAAYTAEPTAEETQLVNDLLLVWGKFEPCAAKNPALIRRGVLFGMQLQKSIAAGSVVPLPVRAKRKGPKPQGTP